MGYGRIPPTGGEIQATHYRYVVGGARGNVGPEMVSVLGGVVGGVASVTNPGEATGGTDEETTEEARRRAPELLRSSGRAVTAEDYERLVISAVPGVAAVLPAATIVHRV